jgi:hypothetical protein
MDKLQSWVGLPTIKGRKRHEHFTFKPTPLSSFVPINILNVLIEEKVDTALSASTWKNKLLIGDEAIGLLTEIKDQLYEINKELKSLRTPTEEVLVFREISKEEAKKEIKKYFFEHKGSEISYSDLVRETNLDLRLVVNICSELEAEGLIG